MLKRIKKERKEANVADRKNKHIEGYYNKDEVCARLNLAKTSLNVYIWRGIFPKPDRIEGAKKAAYWSDDVIERYVRQNYVEVEG